MSKKEEKIEIDNIHEFLVKTSNIIDKSNDNSKKEIIKQLNKYLLTIFNQKNELDNFFNILRSLIFPIKSNEMISSIDKIEKQKYFIKQPFLLYPIIYSFNPKLSIEYIDYFLFSLKLSVSEENKSDFSFLSKIFSDIIACFYNPNIDIFLDNEIKEKLYQKFFTFICNFLKINKKTEQSFGCLLLIELIEKCPNIQKENNLSILFKEISIFLENKSFECKIDLLNCIISLIFRVKEKFKSHANVCLFRILDYLTDDDWIKRKLAINIVYTLVFYCKEEIMAVKENIIEFLNILKEDNIPEVREVCLQTLKFIKEDETNDINEIEKKQNIIQKIKSENANIINIEINHSLNSLGNKKNKLAKQNSNNIDKKKLEKSKNNFNNSLHKKNKSNLDKINVNKDKSKKEFTFKKNEKKEQIFNSKSKELIKEAKNIPKNNSTLMKSFYIPSFINEYNQKRINKGNLTDRNNNNSLNNSIIFENYKNMSNSFIIKNNLDILDEKEKQGLNETIQKRSFNNLKKNNTKNNTKKLVKKDTNQELREKFSKEKALLEEIEKQLNERRSKPSYANKNINKKSLKLNNLKNGKNNNKDVYINKKEEKKSEKILNANKRQASESKIKYKESIESLDIPIATNNLNNNNLDNSVSCKDIIQENESKSNYFKILDKLNKMQENQNNLLLMINDLKNTVDRNYNSLNDRITKLESYHVNRTNINNEINSKNVLLKNKEISDKIKIEMIKNKFKSGNLNEALIESKENEKYLFKILPLISAENTIKIDISIIEEIISKLYITISKINNNEINNNMNILISFFNQIINSKINLNSKVKSILIDTLNIIKEENNFKLSKNDINSINIILKSIKL